MEIPVNLTSMYYKFWRWFCSFAKDSDIDMPNCFPPILKINDEVPNNYKHFRCGSFNPSYSVISDNATDEIRDILPVSCYIEIFSSSIVKVIEKEFHNKLTDEQVNIFIFHIMIHEFCHYYEHLLYYKNYNEGTCEAVEYAAFIDALPPIEYNTFKNSSKKISKRAQDSEYITETRCLTFISNVFSDYLENPQSLIDDGITENSIKEVQLMVEYLFAIFKEKFGDDCIVPSNYKTNRQAVYVVSDIRTQPNEQNTIKFI